MPHYLNMKPQWGVTLYSLLHYVMHAAAVCGIDAKGAVIAAVRVS